MSRAVALTCNNCGASLDVPEQIQFVTCDHCNARLRIERSDGAVFTQVLEAVARVEKQTSANAANVRVIELERELEKIDAARRALHDPGGWGVFWMCVVIAGLSSLLLLKDSNEAKAYGILGPLFFGSISLFLGWSHPRRRREYDQSLARLDGQHAECAETLAVAREQAARASNAS